MELCAAASGCFESFRNSSLGSSKELRLPHPGARRGFTLLQPRHPTSEPLGACGQLLPTILGPRRVHLGRARRVQAEGGVDLRRFASTGCRLPSFSSKRPRKFWICRTTCTHPYLSYHLLQRLLPHPAYLVVIKGRTVELESRGLS